MMEDNEARNSGDTQPISRKFLDQLETRADDVGEKDGVQDRDSARGKSAVSSNQDNIPTPVPVVIPRDEVMVEPRRRSAPAALWGLTILAIVVSLTSLAVNAVLVYRLMDVQKILYDGVDAAVTGLDTLGGQGFHYEYHFDQTVPFSGDIPFKQDLVFPFQGDIPINTVVKVPVDAGVLGKFTIDVPIDTSFYIDLEVPISVDQTIHVDTEIPLDMVIPIDIQADDPQIQKLLDQVRSWLLQLRGSF